MAIKIYDGEQLLLGFEEPIYERDTNSITEQAGYVDAETQVKRMMIAGATLQDFRRGLSSDLFEYPDCDVPDDVKPDPTMDPMFDLSDGSQLLLDFQAKEKAYLEAKKALEARGAAVAAALQKEGGKGETSPVSGVPSTSSV